MSRFERNQTSLVDKKIREEVKHPKIGKIAQVFEHAASDDDSNWEVTVELDGGTVQMQRIPVHAPGSDSFEAPKVGDKILVIPTEGEASRPVAFGTGWSNKDRPPLGRAGMYRNRFESTSSPAGDGSLHITGYTEYNEPVSSNDKEDVTPEKSFVQITKHVEGENANPGTASDLPAKVEMFDSPSTDEAWISVEINKRNGSDTDVTWGMKFNIKTGEVKLVDSAGTGFKSDGDGNWEWQYESKNETTVTGGGSLSL